MRSPQDRLPTRTRRPHDNSALSSGGRVSVRKRAIIGCSLIGFGSSASFLMMAFLLGSPLVALVSAILGIVSAVDVWLLLK